MSQAASRSPVLEQQLERRLSHLGHRVGQRRLKRCGDGSACTSSSPTSSNEMPAGIHQTDRREQSSTSSWVSTRTDGTVTPWMTLTPIPTAAGNQVAILGTSNFFCNSSRSTSLHDG